MNGSKYKVSIEEVVKNNDVIRQAVIISLCEREVSPSIYLESYYTEYLNGRNLSDICLDIITIYEENAERIQFDKDKYCNYDIMKHSIYVKVVNLENNKKFLEKVLWRPYLDLALVVYVLFEEETSGRGTINIQYKNLEMWEVDENTLFNDALKNTREKMKCKIEKLDDVIMRIFLQKYTECQDDEVKKMIVTTLNKSEMLSERQMYVITNEAQSYGAVYIAFETVIKELADSIDSDLYLLPSSVHELMAIPIGKNVTKEELEDMVKDINKTELDPVEVLSDTVYEFRRGSGILWK